MHERRAVAGSPPSTEGPGRIAETKAREKLDSVSKKVVRLKKELEEATAAEREAAEAAAAAIQAHKEALEEKVKSRLTPHRAGAGGRDATADTWHLPRGTSRGD